MFVLTNISIMVAYGRLTWLPSPWDEVRNVGEKPTKFLLKVSISAGKRVEGFWFFSFYAENCGEMSRSAKRGTNGAMEQWYQKKIHMFCSFVTIDPIAFAEFFKRIFFCWWICLGSMFLLVPCLIMVKVPPPFSTSIQDGYLEVGEIMQATLDVGLIPWCIPC